MKRFFLVFLSISLLLLCAGCNNSKDINIVLPLLQETLGLSDADLFAFAADGAVLDLSEATGQRTLIKPYKLGSMSGFLSLFFVTDEPDTEVTRDNAICLGMDFYVRGDSSYYELVKESFSEPGLESWEGQILENVVQAKDNEFYFCYGFFEYGGVRYEGRVHYLTLQTEPYYIEELESLLGSKWPEVSFHVKKWE